MTDTKKKALALVNEVRAERRDPPMVGLSRDCFASQEALCRAIEQHEAFKQEVSDGLVAYRSAASIQQRENIWDALTRFILPNADPLVEAVIDVWPASCDEHVAELRAALAARGLEIREVGHD